MTTKRKTVEEVKEFIKNESNGEYELLSNTYTNQLQKLDIRHYLSDGTYHDYSSSYKLFKRGCRCPICNEDRLKNNNSRRKTLEQAKQDVLDKFGGEYELMIDEYKSNKEKIAIKHNLDNGDSHIFHMRLNDLLSGHKCNFCVPSKLTNEIANKNIKQKTNNEFELVSNITKARSVITVRHIECGTEFECTYYAVTRDNVSCPKCNGSKGENALEKLFEERNISYKSQYKIPECKNKKVLPFDFLIEYKGIKALIEFDGIQHYKPIYGEDKFKKRQKNDCIKTKFCKDNDIPLLRIKDTFIKNMDVILDNFLFNLEYEQSIKEINC